jgi:hypothetical protein
MNWKEIVPRDKEIRETEEEASEALGKLRYDNTIGLHPNAKQPGFTEYAEHCGLSRKVVQRYARAYEKFQAENGPRRAVFADYLFAEHKSEDEQQAIEDVAEVRGISRNSAERLHRESVAKVKRATKRQIERGASPSEAREFGRKVARQQVRTEERRAEERRERRASTVQVLVDLMLAIDGARYKLTDALVIAKEGDMNTETMAQANVALDKVRTVLGLLEMAVAGSAEIDWDAELAKLGDS